MAGAKGVKISPTRRKALAVLAAAATGAVALLTLSSKGMRRPGSNPRPARTPDEARAMIAAIRAGEGERVSDECHTVLLEPDRAAPETPTIVLMHGLTVCPSQFAWIGGVLRNIGYRVLLPLQPYHGLRDLLNVELEKLRAEDLTAWADKTIDAAAGFGGPVWVMGLSAGGLMASWAAYVRPEVERLVAIAPFAAPHGYRWAAIRTAARLESVAPKTYHWWDPDLKADVATSPYGYPGFPMRAATAYMKVSAALFDGRLPAQPNLRRAVLILNEGDDQIDPDRARESFRRSFQGRTERYSEVEIPRSRGWGHDFVAPWTKPRPEPHEVLEILLTALGADSPEAMAISAEYAPPREQADGTERSQVVRSEPHADTALMP